MSVTLAKGIESDVQEIGGKGNSLLKLVNAGISVPDGFVIPASYFLETLRENGVYEETVNICANTNLDNFIENSAVLQNIVANCTVGFDLGEQIRRLKAPVAVRSSSVSEDGENYSFAGLHDSFLNVTGEEVVTYVKKVWASLFNDRALFYRLHKNLPLFEGIAVIVLEMVRADYAGVVFTKHPIEQNHLLVEVTSGTADGLVDGSVIPNRYLLDRNTHKITSAEITQRIAVDEKTIEALAVKCLEIENLYGKPQDIEWAVGTQLYFLQSRDVVFTNVLNEKITEIESQHNWTLISSKISPTLWKSWTAKGNTRDSLLKYTQEDIFIAMKQEELLYLKDVDDYQRIREYYESIFAKDLNHFYWVQERCAEIHDVFLNFCTARRKSDFTKLSDTELIAFFNEYIEKIIATASFRTNIFLLGQIITDLINQEIERIKATEPDTAFYYELVTPIKDLPLTAMQRNILFIGQKIEQEKLDLDSPAVQSLIADHIEKYSWLTTHRYFGEPLTRADVLATLQENLGKASEKLATLKADNVKREEELARVTGINKTIAKLIDIARNYTYIQTYRLDVVNEGNHYLKGMFNEICARIGVEFGNLIYLTEDEIVAALAGADFDYNRLANLRKEYYVIYNVNGDEIYIFEGLSNKYINADEAAPAEELKDSVINGKVAQRGRTRGAVKVIKTKQELSKLNDGDIIVCPMTMPEMIIGLLKCGGIITDEGGVTCHAAQISRELKVPCVIGTGNASKLLNDGDTVEIIAEGINGEIRILESA